ncbi:site-specific DNA-methyltransferase [Pseudodesulfovibrio indicus]|uniref:Uncharacterized protein n=1 Tax=Pseudodesulfovibrio indicus TaxID=1716143 RepID=A0AA94TK89_9BACT|nr:site-specific DNA-methyltransferase [Pseudodesulfovibrio indicus]TDT91013.1 hypothetical protein EDC59_102448 [Pseudodesulfovibrio indicus]
MITYTAQHDSALRERFNLLTTADPDYWSFRGNSRREHGHAFFQYPAMMVPQMVKTVLNKVNEIHPDIEWVGDPFAGSGTILTETMNAGFNFQGNDINPLAILLCRVKSGPFFIKSLNNKSEALTQRIDADSKTNVSIDFRGIDKWFRKDVQIALSRIRRAILKQKSKWARRFFWIALAEVVRLTSNSRTSTFKLHIRPQNQVNERIVDPIGLFKKTLSRNLEHLNSHKQLLDHKGHLSNGRYSQIVDVNLADTRSNTVKEHLSDVIVTSPPYGDNTTTVPYGQYSYLPLQWIDLTDIDASIDERILNTTQEIDSRSLGGNKRILAQDSEMLCDLSLSLSECLDKLKPFPRDRTNRVVAFFRDLNACLPSVLGGLREGGVMIWTLGNRKVGGEIIPLDLILSELLAHHHTTLISSITREIPSKRMALRNNVADTMSTERVLVMRKAA